MGCVRACAPSGRQRVLGHKPHTLRDLGRRAEPRAGGFSRDDGRRTRNPRRNGLVSGPGHTAHGARHRGRAGREGFTRPLGLGHLPGGFPRAHHHGARQAAGLDAEARHPGRLSDRTAALSSRVERPRS